MMAFSLNGATQEELDALSSLFAPPVLTTIPATDASKAGRLFTYQGKTWRYARTGEFGTLPEGTPWPTKGYKGVSFVVTYNSSNTGMDKLLQNDFGSNITISRDSAGVYLADFDGPLPNGLGLQNVMRHAVQRGFGGSVGTEILFPSVRQDPGIDNNFQLKISSYDLAGNLVEPASINYAFVELKLYPNQS